MNDDTYVRVCIPINSDTTQSYNNDDIEEDEVGKYVEIYFDEAISNVILEPDQALQPGDVAALRVYISQDIKRSVVVKEDAILTKNETVVEVVCQCLVNV